MATRNPRAVASKPMDDVLSLPTSGPRPPIVDVLREAIRQRLFEPGQPLIQASIAEALGVSRIPVREALHALAAVGAVRSVQNDQSQVWRELSCLALPPVQKARRHNQQGGLSRPSFAAGLEQRQRLDRFAEPHIIRKDGAKPGLQQGAHPCGSKGLIVA